MALPYSQNVLGVLLNPFFRFKHFVLVFKWVSFHPLLDTKSWAYFSHMLVKYVAPLVRKTKNKDFNAFHTLPSIHSFKCKFQLLHKNMYFVSIEQKRTYLIQFKTKIITFPSPSILHNIVFIYYTSNIITSLFKILFVALDMLSSCQQNFNYHDNTSAMSTHVCQMIN
jgi:hypothetical protein